jgi:Uncharacterized protein family UPF0016
MRWVLGLSFVAMALWTLILDRYEESRDTAPRFGVFGTTLIAFIFFEMGDKTQIATVALAATYSSLVGVVAGTTLGMMLANVPAVLIGEVAAKKLPMQLVHGISGDDLLCLGSVRAARIRLLLTADGVLAEVLREHALLVDRLIENVPGGTSASLSPHEWRLGWEFPLLAAFGWNRRRLRISCDMARLTSRTLPVWRSSHSHRSIHTLHRSTSVGGRPLSDANTPSNGTSVNPVIGCRSADQVEGLL